MKDKELVKKAIHVRYDWPTGKKHSSIGVRDFSSLWFLLLIFCKSFLWDKGFTETDTWATGVIYDFKHSAAADEKTSGKKWLIMFCNLLFDCSDSLLALVELLYFEYRLIVASVSLCSISCVAISTIKYPNTNHTVLQKEIVYIMHMHGKKSHINEASSVKFLNIIPCVELSLK